MKYGIDPLISRTLENLSPDILQLRSKGTENQKKYARERFLGISTGKIKIGMYSIKITSIISR